MNLLLLTLLKYYLPTFFILYNVWYYLSDSWLLWFTKLSAIGSLAIISWTLAYFLYEQLNTETVNPNGKIVLVTGCDTGFGHDLASRLDRYGFHVFAGVLAPEGDGATKLAQRCSKRLKIVKMDVTKPEDVSSVIDQIKQTNMSLWSVVNNAGIGFGAFFDWGHDVEPYQKLLDVNLFGVIRVTKACMPLIRKSKGRIVNVASLAARITPACTSHYCIAKHGVRVFSDAIRREFQITGDEISVVTIEPTFYKTEIINRDAMKRFREQIYASSPEEIKAFYDGCAISGEQMFNQVQEGIEAICRPNIGEVTEAMESAVTLENPKLFYRCGGYQDVLIWAASHAPEALLDYTMNNSFGKYFIRALVWVINKLH